jgi:hypothetical protein
MGYCEFKGIIKTNCIGQSELVVLKLECKKGYIWGIVAKRCHQTSFN